MFLESLRYLKDVLYREPSFILKYYLFHRNWENERVDYVFMADGKMVHGGLFDRLKGIISIYALSKVHNKRFGILFKEPFILEKYLKPASYAWNVDADNIVYCYPLSRPVIAYSESKHPHRLLRNREGQTHFYFGGDILSIINQKYNTGFNWSTLFHELFIPSDSVVDFVIARKKEINADYDAVHFRFVNLLGDHIEECRYPELNEAGKIQLVNQCIERLRGLSSLSRKEGRRMVVASDSMIFLEKIKDQLPDIYVVSGTVKHIDKAQGSSEDVFLKLFADMYLLAGAENVYSIVGNGLYPSAFPEYSAKVGGKAVKRIPIEND